MSQQPGPCGHNALQRIALVCCQENQTSADRILTKGCITPTMVTLRLVHSEAALSVHALHTSLQPHTTVAFAYSVYCNR